MHRLSKAALVLCLSVVALVPGQVAAGEPVDFAASIAPIFREHCLKCHQPGSAEGDLSLATFDGLRDFLYVVPGRPDQSYLIDVISGPQPAMPKEGKPLSEEQVALIRRWIAAGAVWPDGLIIKTVSAATSNWSLQPLASVKPPKCDAAPGGLPRNPIDRFVAARLIARGLTSAPEADRRTLIRRVYLDVLGLLPSPKRVARFVGDKRPDAYRRLIDEVLASPHYGERWARYWLDVVSFAESNGFETNQERRHAYHYRDWVIRAFNEDMPYDRFVVAQLAGDTIGEDAATGFLVAGAYDRVKSPDPVLTAIQRQDELADMVNTTSTAFLGLTIGCARCHNHKFDPITQSDYYSIAAVFAGVHHGDRALPVPTSPANRERVEELETKIAALDKQLRAVLRPPVSARVNEERFEPVVARFVRFTALETNSGLQPCLDELEIYAAGVDEDNAVNVARMDGVHLSSSGNYKGSPRHKLKHLNDGVYGNSHSWISDTNGDGWAQVELPKLVSIDRIVWGRDREGRYTDRLAIKYRIEIATEPGQWRTVADSTDRLPTRMPVSFRPRGMAPVLAERVEGWMKKKARLEAELSKLTAPTMAYVGQFQQPGPTHRLYRGDPQAPREVVAPDTVEVLGSLDLKTNAPEQSRRLALAKSIVSPENPLTARVMVNRIWQYHFGRGLVATPSDFGNMGAKPTHPKLLDWLAVEFMAGDWSIKRMHRLILLSATYRQSSRPRANELREDGQTTLLWRFPPRRLTAEAIRDNILRTSGVLDQRMGGPGFLLFHPNTNYSRNWIAKDEFGPPEFRRMIYAFDLRMKRDAVFGAFDRPTGGRPCPRRGRSTTPIQSLNLFNSPFLVEQAGLFAERVRHEAGEDIGRQIDRVFALALLREPSANERVSAVQLVESHGLPALCRAVFNTNEFLFLR